MRRSFRMAGKYCRFNEIFIKAASMFFHADRSNAIPIAAGKRILFPGFAPISTITWYSLGSRGARCSVQAERMAEIIPVNLIRVMPAQGRMAPFFSAFPSHYFF